MSKKLILECSDVNVSKVSGDCFQWWLRVSNGNCEFYKIVASDKKEFNDCFGVVDDE